MRDEPDSPDALDGSRSPAPHGPAAQPHGADDKPTAEVRCKCRHPIAVLFAARVVFKRASTISIIPHVVSASQPEAPGSTPQGKETCERGNKHLALTWGKPPPTRKFATFKVGEDKARRPPPPQPTRPLRAHASGRQSIPRFRRRGSHAGLQESVPVIRMLRPSSVRPCYRSWTTLQKNV